LKQILITSLISTTCFCYSQTESVYINQVKVREVSSNSVKFTVSFSKTFDYDDDPNMLVCPFSCSKNYTFHINEILNPESIVSEGTYVLKSENQFDCMSAIIPEGIIDKVSCDDIDDSSQRTFKKNKKYNFYLKATVPFYQYLNGKEFVIILLEGNNRHLFFTSSLYKKYKK